MGTYAKRFWQDVRELSRAEVVERIRSHAEDLPKGTWIVAQGTFGQGPPSREELDRAAPEHPVAIRWSMHKVVANSQALRASGIDRETPDPPGSRIGRTESGEPTGVIEEGFDLLAVPRAGFDDLKEALHVYTAFSAYSGFHERTRGSIEEGKLADLVVLSSNPLEVKPDDLLLIQVEMTILDGKVAFQRRDIGEAELREPS